MIRTKLTVFWFLFSILTFPILAYLNFNLLLAMSGLLWAWIVLIIGQVLAAHRYFVHQSFEANKFQQIVMNFFLTIGFQGTSQDWIISHSYHHRVADSKEDPTNVKVIGLFKNYTSLWQLNSPVSTASIRLSLRSLQNPITKFFHNNYYTIWILWGLLLLSQSFEIFVWFFFLPVIFSHCFMNLQNHLGHKSDVSYVINLLAPGDGYHKFHHENPRKARYGKYDLIALLIDLFFSIKK